LARAKTSEARRKEDLAGSAKVAKEHE